MALTSTEEAAAEKRAIDRYVREQKIQDEMDAERRATARLAASGVTIKSSSSGSGTGESKTASTLLNVIYAIMLAVVTIVFLHYFNTNQTFVLISVCGFIVVYTAFMVYYINKTDDTYGSDKTLAIVARWSSILALVLSVLLAISTTKAALFPGKKPEPAAGKQPIYTSNGAQMYPPQQRPPRPPRNNGGPQQQGPQGPQGPGPRPQQQQYQPQQQPYPAGY